VSSFFNAPVSAAFGGNANLHPTANIPIGAPSHFGIAGATHSVSSMSTALASAHVGGSTVGGDTSTVGQRSHSGSVLGSRTSRDRDLSDPGKTAAKHALSTPYPENNRSQTVSYSSGQVLIFVVRQRATFKFLATLVAGHVWCFVWCFVLHPAQVSKY
jgi:hypothetical protein